MDTWQENAKGCGRIVHEDKSAHVRYLAWQSANIETGNLRDDLRNRQFERWSKSERCKETCAISLALIEVVTVGPQNPFACNATCANPVAWTLHIITAM